MKQNRIFIVLMLIAIVLIPNNTSAISAYEDISPPDSVVYKQTPEADLKLYFHYPEDWKPDDERPVIVFFFGGGWVSGRITHFSPQAKYLASRGMVAVRADYRVRNRHGTSPAECVEDGKSAIRWVRENAGLIGVDPDRIVASGGSAGGHVAACTYTAIGFEASGEDHSISSRPNLLVLFNPVMETGFEQLFERFGGKDVAEKLSPNRYIDETTPPLIMYFGSDDRLIETAYQTLALRKKYGLDARLWIADGVGHGFFNRSPWMESTLYLMDRFLLESGYLKGEPAIRMPADGKMYQYTGK